MHVLAMQTAAEGAGQIEKIASTFGVNWPHLLSQIVSFGIVCVVLYLLAYKPILRILEARRQQIAGGLANAEKIKAELARIEAERLGILTKADGEGKQLIEEARAAAARVQAEETRKAIAAAEQIVVRAHEAAERDRATMLAELKHEVGRLVVQTTASVAGKILTPEDHRRLAEETARHFTPEQRLGLARRGSPCERSAASEEDRRKRRAMKANRKVKRAARQLFRLCLVNGALDEGRARQVAQRIAASRRRGALAILSDFQRLVRLDSDRHSALVESATPLAARHAGRHPGWPHASVRAGTRSHLRRESSAHRRDADQSRQRCVRRQRAGPPGGARGTSVTSWSEMTYG